MTIRDAGTALDGIWLKLKGLRDKWLLIAFAMSSLVWMEGTIRDYIALPEQIGQQVEAAEDLARRMSTLERHLARRRCGPLLGLSFGTDAAGPMALKI